MTIEFQRDKIIPINLVEEMKDSYLDYSMSVIVSRALPDVRDGLKPVHRRILYGMDGLNLRYNQKYKKCARIVGEVLGKYHPHGDSAVYDALVRMAQDFAMRYPLIDGLGNFGSVDGDSAAAMRYTEARMARISSELLRDIDKETVEFRPNFDETLKEPVVLPAVVPNLLINGANGIAVGMATNIPPHNLNEVVDAIIYQIDNPDTSVEELMQFIQGPDFPTGAIILGKEGIKEAYTTGRGKVKVRARATVETFRGGKDAIVITEIPYQVNKANLIEKIADLVRSKKIEGISDIRDESDKEGIRIVIDLKKDVVPEVILNQLYQHTQLQETFGIIMLALVDGVPRVLPLKDVISEFIKFRHEIVVKRTEYDLRQAEEKAHILEGLKIALDNIDEVIQLIRSSNSPAEAKEKLIQRFNFSEKQAQAILDMRLQKLTSLEVSKVVQEYKDTLKLIEKLKGILENRALRMQIIKDELLEVKERYGDPRRTDILPDPGDFSIEDMIAEEDMVITITYNGFIKRYPVSGYRRQHRGGKGIMGAATKDDDFVNDLFVASTHDYLLIFTNYGKCYWLKVHTIPQAGRTARGRAIVNLIGCTTGEKPRAILKVRDFDDQHYVVMVTRKGTIKKTSLSAFSNPRKTGIKAIHINDGDDLVDVQLTNGNQDIVLGTYYGKAIRFNEKNVRAMGRTAAGVRGITLAAEDDYVVGLVVVKREGGTLLVVTENGYGKRSDIMDYRVTNRGGKGIITIRTTERNGHMIAIMEVVDSDDLMMITEKGILIRQSVADIRTISRNTQGVRLIRLSEGDRLAAVARVVENHKKTENDDNLSLELES